MTGSAVGAEEQLRLTDAGGRIAHDAEQRA
jgi:hypothetical protein